MQTYTNKFSIALNHDKTEVMINFSQNIPVIPLNDGEPKVLVAETGLPAEVMSVANLAMTGQCARNLANMLLTLLDQDIS